MISALSNRLNIDPSSSIPVKVRRLCHPFRALLEEVLVFIIAWQGIIFSFPLRSGHLILLKRGLIMQRSVYPPSRPTAPHRLSRTRLKFCLESRQTHFLGVGAPLGRGLAKKLAGATIGLVRGKDRRCRVDRRCYLIICRPHESPTAPTHHRSNCRTPKAAAYRQLLASLSHAPCAAPRRCLVGRQYVQAMPA